MIELIADPLRFAGTNLPSALREALREIHYIYFDFDGLSLPSTRDCTSLNFKVYMYRPKYNTALTSARERVAVVGRFYAWGTTLRRRQRPRVSKRKLKLVALLGFLTRGPYRQATSS